MAQDTLITWPVWEKYNSLFTNDVLYIERLLKQSFSTKQMGYYLPVEINKALPGKSVQCLLQQKKVTISELNTC